MKQFLRQLFALCAAVFFAQLANGQTNPAPCTSGRFIDPVFTKLNMREVRYAKAVNFLGVNQDLMADVYQPVGDTMQKRPLIIYVHGGAFVAGDRKLPEALLFCQTFARKGYVVASIQYRLGCDLPINKDNMLKAVIRALQDARGAIQYFRWNAAQGGNTFKIDPNQVYIAGYSAGAITALHLAYLDKASEFQQIAPLSLLNSMGGINSSSGSHHNYPWKVNGVITFAGALGKATWMEPGDPPLISMHGTEDHIVPFNTGEPIMGVINPPLFMDGSRVIDSVAATVGVCDDLWAIRGRDHVVFYTSPDIALKCMDFITPRLCAMRYNIPFCCANFNATAFANASEVCKGESTQLNVQIQNKNGPITYSWSAGVSNPTLANPTVTPTATTTYSVTVHDAAGCVVNSTVTVKVNPRPVANAGPDKTTCAGENVTLNGSATGGSGAGYVYNWAPSAGLTNANTDTPTANPTVSTLYTLTVTDSKGCSSSADVVQVTVLPRPAVSTAATDATCFGCADGSITATATGGVAPYTYWLNGVAQQNNGSFTGLASGSYQVTVVGQNGCSSSQTVFVNQPAFVCNTPANFTITNVIDSAATLNWTPVNGAIGYEIAYRMTGAPNWTVFVSNNVPTRLDTLYPKVSYEVKVRALCVGGSVSNYTAPQTFTTLDGCVPPYYITIDPGSVSAVISWEDVPHATGYWVSYKSSIDLVWTDVWVVTNWYAFASILIPFTTYEVRVKTDCSGLLNNSFWSPTRTFTTTSPRLGAGNALYFNRLTLYPNPSHGQFSLGFAQSPDADFDVKITDLTGRQIFAQSYKANEVDKTLSLSLPNPTAGVYLLEYRSANQTERIKFVIE